MGRTAAGIRGIRIKKGDEVIGMDIIEKLLNGTKNEDKYLLVVTDNGYGKRTSLKEFKLQGRGGSGVRAAKVTSKTGDLINFKILTGNEEDLIVISQRGHTIRIKISSIPKIGRDTQGVRIIKLDAGDKVASVTCI